MFPSAMPGLADWLEFQDKGAVWVSDLTGYSPDGNLGCQPAVPMGTILARKVSHIATPGQRRGFHIYGQGVSPARWVAWDMGQSGNSSEYPPTAGECLGAFLCATLK